MTRELVTPTGRLLHVNQQMLIVVLLTVEGVEVALQGVVPIKVLIEVPVDIKQVEAPKRLLEMTNTHQETRSLGNPLRRFLSFALAQSI